MTVFQGTFKFDNFYFNYHIKANQVNFSSFFRFELRIPGLHYSVPPNVHLGTVNQGPCNLNQIICNKNSCTIQNEKIVRIKLGSFILIYSMMGLLYTKTSPSIKKSV